MRMCCSFGPLLVADISASVTYIVYCVVLDVPKSINFIFNGNFARCEPFTWIVLLQFLVSWVHFAFCRIEKLKKKKNDKRYEFPMPETMPGSLTVWRTQNQYDFYKWKAIHCWMFRTNDTMNNKRISFDTHTHIHAHVTNTNQANPIQRNYIPHSIVFA